MTGVDEEIEDREDEGNGKCWVKGDLRLQAFVIIFSYLITDWTTLWIYD